MFTTTVAEIYNVSLTADKYADTVAPNRTLTYTLTVENTGNMNDTYNLTVDDPKPEQNRDETSAAG